MTKKKTEIVSLTFLGTKHHRATHHTTLRNLHDRIEEHSQTPEGAHVAARLFDGVGCHGTKEHPTPGTYVCHFDRTNPPVDKIESTQAVESKIDQGVKMVIPEKDITKELKELIKFNNWMYLRETRSQISGKGSTSLLLEARRYIENIIIENGGELPKVVNLQGFSRGADACVRMANILFRNYREIKVNLCLIDPVPGPARARDWDSFTVPPNVQNCQITYMMNEHFYFFAPQSPKKYVFESNKTRCRTHMLAGIHGAGIALTKHWHSPVPSSYYLCQDALWRFATDPDYGALPANANLSGSLPKDAKILHQQVRLGEASYEIQALENPQELYSKAHRFELYCKNLAEFKRLESRFEAQYLYPRRDVLDHRHEVVRTPELFMDEEHRELFKTLYPRVFNWFFEGNSDNNRKIDIYSQLKTIAPQSYAQTLLNFFEIPSTIQKLEVTAPTPGHPELREGSPKHGPMPQLRRPLAELGMTGEQLQLEITALKGPSGNERKERTRFNQQLVTDELSYFQNALTRIVQYYELHGGSSEKNNQQSKRHIEQIKSNLANLYDFSDEIALQRLRKVIENIQEAYEDESYIRKEVCKIAELSTEYANDVLSVLKMAEGLAITDDQKEIIKKNLELINQLIESQSSGANSWEIRAKIQNRIIWMHAELQIIEGNITLNPHKQPTFFQSLRNRKASVAKPVENADFAMLSKELSRLSEATYSETDLVDRVVSKLQAYQFRLSFLWFFTCILRVYDPHPVAVAKDLETRLMNLKKIGAGNNLIAINAVLTEGKTQLNIQEHHPDAFAFVYLNKILKKAIQETKVKVLLYRPPEITPIQSESTPNLKQ